MNNNRKDKKQRKYIYKQEIKWYIYKQKVKRLIKQK